MKNKKIGIILVYVIIVILAILLFSYKFELLESGYAKYNTLKQENTENTENLEKAEAPKKTAKKSKAAVQEAAENEE